MVEQMKRLLRREPGPIVDNPEYTEEASEMVKRALKYTRKGKALDIGTQRGRNALFLARNGFRVTATDVTEKGFDTLRENARNSGILTRLRIKTKLKDARDGLSGMYHMMVCSRMLNLLPRKEHALAIIKDMMTHTRSGGINVLEAPTKDGDFYRGAHPTGVAFYPEPRSEKRPVSELEQIYIDAGWQILEYEQKQMEYRVQLEEINHPKNLTSLLISQKP